MEIGLIAPYAVAALLLAACVGLYITMTAAKGRAEAENTRLSGELDGLRQELRDANLRLTEALQRQTEADTRRAAAEQDVAEMKDTRDQALQEKEAARTAQQAAIQDAALARQDLQGMKDRMADWEKAKAESIEAAKAAALSSAKELSGKLIEDHKRENAEAKEQSEEQVRKTTEGLTQQFENIIKSVASLHDNVGEARDKVDVVYQALSTPGGAGKFAEIGLENLLKQLGLEPERDFRMQHAVAGESGRKSLRPDAVVFLPHDSVMVIDSKASKFIMDLAEAEGTEDEEAAYASLAQTMNTHLRGLAGRDYRKAIEDAHKRAGHGGALRRVINIMYLPNDGALEKVNIADPGFAAKAVKADIIVTGPTGLTGLMGFASMEIGLARQDENRDRIVDQTGALLESVATVLGHAEAVGKGIHSAARHFQKLSSSVNSRLLPRARRLVGLGVNPGNRKSLPGNLQTYEMVALETADVIDGDVVEFSQQKRLTKPDDDDPDEPTSEKADEPGPTSRAAP
jgi:DNA recombination protein RmuC